MKRLDILNLRLDQLKENESILETRIMNLAYRKSNELKLMFERYFTPSAPGFIIEARDEYVCLKNESSNWDIASFSIRSRWTDDNEEVKKTSFSYGSFNAEGIGEWVLNRLDALKEFTNVAIDFEDDIVAEWNKITKRYSDLRSPLWDKRRKLSNAINDQRNAIKSLEKEERLAKLSSTGIDFKRDDRGRLPELEAKFDWSLRNVRNLKVLRTTASGKSADIEVTQEFRNWDNETKVETQTIDRVRWDKIDQMIRYNSNQIK